MKEKKISYIMLISDLYLLLALAYIIYGSFFGYERIGLDSYVITPISNMTAILISIGEIFLGFFMSYLLHKCYMKNIRYIAMFVSILNISYRILNIIVVYNFFTIFMLIIGIGLLLNLLLYK